MGRPCLCVARSAEKSNSRSANTVNVPSLTAEVISICRPESGAACAAGVLTSGKEGRAAKKVSEGEFFSSPGRFAGAAARFAERFARLGASFCTACSEEASAASGRGAAVSACDAYRNASVGGADVNRRLAGGGGTASRVRTERTAGKLKANTRQAPATNQTSFCPDGFDHQELFLSCDARGCVLARASG